MNLQDLDMLTSAAPENEHVAPDYFRSLTNKGRHDLIKRHAGKYWKYTPPGLWAFLFYEKTDLTIRYKVNRRREIIAVTTHTIKEGRELAELSKAVFDGLKHNHN